MPVTANALWIIERNCHRQLSLGDLASACNVSRYHLAHAFGASTGVPVMHYVRGRILSGAANALADGAPDILSLALDCGYGSHEAFSRAFRRQFAMTPETVRLNKSTEGLPMTAAMKNPNVPDATIGAPRTMDGAEMLLAGLPMRFTPGSTQEIPAQWQKFMAIYEDIPAKTGHAPFGVYRDMNSDGEFEHVCAVEVAKIMKLPDGLVGLRVPAQTYLVFQHLDHASSLGATYSAIWNDWLPAHHRRTANGPSLERCMAAFDPRTGLGGIEIWIPVEPTAA